MAFGDFTVARTSVKYVLNASGVLASVAADTPAFEFNADGTYRGLLVEPAGTNLALQSRDLTQAVWTATNATTSRTATGADGTANTGTIVTATAGNATILQAITSTSSARVFGARVRRRTGTGTVEITQDNGSTWTAITLTSTYQLFATASQTLTNPTVGFRIVASGDAIDVDFCQAETGAVVTSPIPTVASTATRTADSVTLTGVSSLIGQTEGTLYVEAIFTNVAGSSFARVLECFTGADDRISIVINASTARGFLTTAGVDTQGGTMSESVANNTIYRIALAYAVGASQGAFYVNGTGDITSPTAIPATASINIGQSIVGGAVPQWIRAVALYPTRLPNATLATLTA
jgi:hypothetical protein